MGSRSFDASVMRRDALLYIYCCTAVQQYGCAGSGLQAGVGDTRVLAAAVFASPPWNGVRCRNH